MLEAFSPGDTVTVKVGQDPVSVPVDAMAPVLRIINTGTTMVFVSIGTGVQISATVNAYPIVPGNLPQFISKASGADTVALISGPGQAQTVYITAGY